jgi:hypothetical protein
MVMMAAHGGAFGFGGFRKIEGVWVIESLSDKPWLFPNGQCRP